MLQRTTLLAAALVLPIQLAAQDGECLGYDLKDPEQRIPMAGESAEWTLYNLGPGTVAIHADSGAVHPGPRPSSDPEPSRFTGEAGRVYSVGLAKPGLAIVYICPEG